MADFNLCPRSCRKHNDSGPIDPQVSTAIGCMVAVRPVIIIIYYIIMYIIIDSATHVVLTLYLSIAVVLYTVYLEILAIIKFGDLRKIRL